MERFNPRSDADREEEKEEQEFLNGGQGGGSAGSRDKQVRQTD
jgi:hypothetical protein